MGKVLTNDELATAFREFRKALLEQDEVALCRVVDFPRLQANVKTRLAKSTSERRQRNSSAEWPSGAALLPAMNDAVAEMFFSPAGMLALVTRIIDPGAGAADAYGFRVLEVPRDHVAVVALSYGKAEFTRQPNGWRMTDIFL